jgi:hypothetical protein
MSRLDARTRDRIGRRPATLFGRASVLALAAVLAACSDGGDPGPSPDQPFIESFAADRTHYFVGEAARLTARFSGGDGRIEPGIGPVQSGVAVTTPPLDAPVQYRLVVEHAGRTIERRLSLPVAHRDRYRTLTATLRAARHTAMLAGDGSVIVIGGSRGEAVLSAAVNRFDPAAETITQIGSLATGRESHTTTRLADGRLLVAGGIKALKAAMPEELVDERTGTVVPTGRIAVERYGHTATLLANGSVLVTGGYAQVATGISDSAEIWDPQTGTFRLLDARLNAPRAAHTATALADGRVLIAGGYSPRAPYVFAEIFDPVAERFDVVPTNEWNARGLHEAVRLSDGTVLVLGGENFLDDYDSVLRFRPATTSFEVAPNLLRGRTLVRAVATPDDRVLLFGGERLPEFAKLASAEVYDPAAGGFELAPMPIARGWHSVTRLTDGRVLVLGGETDGGALVPDVLLYE